MLGVGFEPTRSSLQAILSRTPWTSSGILALFFSPTHATTSGNRTSSPRRKNKTKDQNPSPISVFSAVYIELCTHGHTPIQYPWVDEKELHTKTNEARRGEARSPVLGCVTMAIMGTRSRRRGTRLHSADAEPTTSRLGVGPEKKPIKKKKGKGTTVSSCVHEVDSKRCFVTVGTTKFEDLVKGMDTEVVLEALVSAGYTNLVLQIGRGQYEPTGVLKPKTTTKKNKGRRKKDTKSKTRAGLQVEYFGLAPTLAPLLGEADLVISHAGAGSLFEALNAQRRVIAVPNPTLMGNHQEELASHLAGSGYLLHATVDPDSIARAVLESETKRLAKYEPGDASGIVGKIDAVVGFAK